MLLNLKQMEKVFSVFIVLIGCYYFAVSSKINLLKDNQMTKKRELVNFIENIDDNGESYPIDYFLNNGFSDGDTIYLCEGNFYDSGGPMGDYGGNGSYEVTFCANNGDKLRADFNSLDINSNTGSLGIYNGIAPPYPSHLNLGRFNNFSSEQPNWPMIASDACLTFRFVAGGTGAGWDISLSCESACINNLLANPSFDEDCDVCSTPSWQTNGISTQRRFWTKEADGAMAAWVTWGDMWQTVNGITAGNQYDLSFYACVHDPSHNQSVSLLSYAGNVRIDSVGVDINHNCNIDSTFGHYNLSLTPSAGADAIRVVASSPGRGFPFKYVKIDRMCLQEIVSPCAGFQMENDTIQICPGTDYMGKVGEQSLNASLVFKLLTPVAKEILVFDATGTFSYKAIDLVCKTDEFSYEVCHQLTACCDTAIVHLILGDTTLPQLFNIPADEVTSCDEVLSLPPLIQALDNCPYIGIAVEEASTQGEDGCSLYDYTLTRTWVATDQCGNSTSDTQIIEIQDVVAPDIYRIYTLPNGKKIVGGVMEFVNENWKTINFPIDFPTPPMIFYQIVTTNEGSTVIAQIQSASVAQFELRIQEEELNDNQHIRESVAWIAIEPGTQTTDYHLEAKEMPIANNVLNENFSTPFTTVPNVFSNLQTTNEEDAAFIRQINLTTTGVTLAIQEETSQDMEVSHSAEIIGYLAIENIGDIKDEKGIIIGETGTTNLSSSWQTIHLNNTYANPVVIANSLGTSDGEPATIRVRNINLDSFEMSVEEWDYLDGIHTAEKVSYLVLEGSIPLESSGYCETGTDNLKIGIDIKAIDNCDVTVTINYTEEKAFLGATTIINRTWEAVDECGNQNAYSQQINCEGVALQMKAALQGALIDSPEDGLMRDDLRQKGLLPLTEPYSKMEGFPHYNGGGGETASSTLFSIEGEDAIVDWVFVELRAASNRDSIIATCAALIQRDGDVVTADGKDTIIFLNVPIGNYYTCIRHRNHLGMQSLYTYTFSTSNIPFVDFTFDFTPVIGSIPGIVAADIRALWAGDLSNDGKVIYQGPQNDIFSMFLHILLNEKNTNSLNNFINNGYSINDFNMDGITIYQGPNNDRASLLFNTILKHPENNNKFSNYIILIDP